MQSIGSGPFAAGHIDPAQTLFNLGIDAGVFPGEGDTFVLVEVIDLIRGIAGAAKSAAGDVLRLTEMLHRVAYQSAHFHGTDAITGEAQMDVVYVASAGEMGIRSLCALGVRGAVGADVAGEHERESEDCQTQKTCMGAVVHRKMPP